MKYKGFTKLTIQIALLSLSMMALSFITDTEWWIEYFNYSVDGSLIDRGEDSIYIRLGCNTLHCSGNRLLHTHWNYRGYIYFYTGLAMFILSVVKIFKSHKEEDFK